MLSQNLHLSHKPEAGTKYNPVQVVFPNEADTLNEAKNYHQSLPLNGLEEEKLRNLGVLPALMQSSTVCLPKHKGDDDPFVERSPDLQRNLFTPYAQDHQVDSNSSLEHSLPLAVKGAIKQEFRLPDYINGPQQDTAKIRNGKTNPINSGARGAPYQRDPMPYSSFSSNKKDILLQNLHDVVESSKAQGNLPISTRTVLYDPFTHSSARHAQQTSSPEVPTTENATQHHHSSEKSSTVPADGDKELLNGSDALPWTDRPVNIQNLASPLASRVGIPSLPRLSTAKKPPPGLGYDSPDIWSMQPQPRKVGRSLEEAESWFMKNSRGGVGLQSWAHPDATNTNEILKPIGDGPTPLEHSKIDSSKKEILQPQAAVDNPTEMEIAKSLCLPAFENLAAYLENSSSSDYLGRFARVPEWCIDKSQNSNLSFFGDWGVPPSRVGRDPRYRATFHEGRYTVFEELDRRGVRDGLGRRFH